MRFSVLLPLFLLITVGPSWADSFDPGDNTRNGASLIPSPSGREQFHGPRTLDAEDPADWFQTLLTAGSTYTLFTEGNTVTIGQIFDQNGTLVAGDDPFNQNGNPFREDFTPPQSGIFFIQITQLDPNAMTTYTLHTLNRTTANAPTDAFDPGDDSPFAPPRLPTPTFDEQTTIQHFLSITDVQDWFLIELQEGLAYEFHTTGNYKIEMGMFTDTGNTRLAAGLPQEHGLNARMIFIPPSSGNYFLQIRANPAGWNASYTLHSIISTDTISPGDEWDPEDDIIEGASILRPSETVNEHGSHTLTPNDVFDWFCAELTAGAVYNFASEPGSNTTVDLIAPDGSTILIPSANIIGEDRFDIDFAPVTSGLYYLRVQKRDVEFTLYNLSFSQTGLLPETLPDQWDPRDNEFAGATNLNTPSQERQTHGPHTLTFDDRGDWFRFTLAEGRTYEFTSTGDADTFGHIFDSDGATQLAGNDDGGVSLNFSIEFTAPADGVYFLLVRMADSGATGEYSLTHRELILPTEDGDQWDPNDNTLAGATELSPNAVGLIHGPHSIGGNDSEDWFQFVLLKDWSYSFTTTGMSDTVGEFLTGDGVTSLQTNDDSGENLNFAIQFTPSETAEFALRITERLNREGTYSLQYIGEPPAAGPIDPGDSINPDALFQLDSTIEFTHIPGGFGAAPAGLLSVTGIPFGEGGFSDGQGVSITVREGEVTLLQFPEFDVGEQTVLIRASVRTTGADVSPALAVADGTFDGSIATTIPAHGSNFVDAYKRMVLLYDAPNDGAITPIFQAAGTSAETTLYLDNVEVYLIPVDRDYPARLLNGK